MKLMKNISTILLIPRKLMKITFYQYIKILKKKDLASNSPQGLICHKTQ